MDHLRNTIAILTDEARPIAERYDIAVERQKGMAEAIASSILQTYDAQVAQKGKSDHV
jgi:hypothetical protein